MTETPSYFASLLERQRLLRRHGFEREPSCEELLDYCMRTEDKLAALADAVGVSLQSDVRGRIFATPTRKEDAW